MLDDTTGTEQSRVAAGCPNERLVMRDLRQRFTENAEQFDALMVEMLAENDRLRKLYDELIMEVATKHPGESRHETALRYIRSAENRSSHCEAQSA